MRSNDLAWQNEIQEFQNEIKALTAELEKFKPQSICTMCGFLVNRRTWRHCAICGVTLSPPPEAHLELMV